MNNEKRVLEAKIEEEKKENQELKKQKGMINTDEYLEKMAREKLGMVKKNERIFIDAGQ
jgi:cell division protein FtsB